MKQPDKTDGIHGRQWKMRTLFAQLSDVCAEFSNPSEHLALDEVTMLLQGKVIFK
jgi:hypothetical protein